MHTGPKSTSTSLLKDCCDLPKCNMVAAAACCTGKYALEGLLPPQQQEAVFELLDVLSMLWRKVVLRSELEGFRQQLHEALHKLEVFFPCSMMYIKTHNTVHLVDKILAVGPLYLTSMFPFERSYRIMKAWITNKRYPEASLAKNVMAFTMATFYKACHGTALSFANSSIFDVGGDDDSPLSVVTPFGVQGNGNWIVTTSSPRNTNKEVGGQQC